MEPRQEKPKATKPRTEAKPNRFRIVQLEARVAPSYQMGAHQNLVVDQFSMGLMLGK
jgi:hypothetical protein